MVEAEGITKTFRDSKRGEIRACDEVSFHARAGEVFGLLGVNGAGKTTLLRILSTVLRPDRGSARVAGFPIDRAPQKVRASIGFLSGSTALYGRLTAREALRYFGELFGMDSGRIERRIGEVSDRLGLGPFLDRLCDRLSTGQKQRVSIARAILHEPPVLVFDEPTAGLDVVTAQTILEFIEEARDHGRTVILSTHIMTEAERLCDRVAIIHEGRLRGEGSVPELLAQTGQKTLEGAFLTLVGYRRGGRDA